MIPETEMDWLIVVGENVLYGPPPEALLEFERLGEDHYCDHNQYAANDDLGEALPRTDGLEEQTPMDTVIQPGRVQAFGWSSARIRELENALRQGRSTNCTKRRLLSLNPKSDVTRSASTTAAASDAAKSGLMVERDDEFQRFTQLKEARASVRGSCLTIEAGRRKENLPSNPKRYFVIGSKFSRAGIHSLASAGSCSSHYRRHPGR